MADIAEQIRRRLEIRFANLLGEIADGINSLVEQSTAYTIVDSAYTAIARDSTIEASSGTFDVTLPTAVGILGKEYTIVNNGVGAITVVPDGSETISGAANYSLASQYDSVTVVSNGIDWLVK